MDPVGTHQKGEGVNDMADGPPQPRSAPLIDGTFNVRDIGGVATRDGRRVLTGRLFRSASLDAVTDQGISDLQALNVRTVLDLRSQSEVDLHGSFPVDRLPVRFEHLRSQVRPPSGDDERSRAFRAQADPMTPMYLKIMETSGTAFARGLSLIGEAENRPAIVHCTSGKDRTGMFVLLLHLILGVSLNDALAEFQQDDETTKRAVDDMLARYPEMGAMEPEKMMRMAGTRDEWAIAALEFIGGEIGVPDWLASHGCDHGAQANIRAGFLAT